MSDPLPEFGLPVGPWHRWFAWRPVLTYDQRLVWFRSLSRRCIQKHNYLDGGAEFWFQYSLDHS